MNSTTEAALGGIPLFSRLNEAQRNAAGATEGPLLIIAGPGSGKTATLVARTVNILVKGLAQPREILLCTFTEKLRDRVVEALRDVYSGDLSELLVGTIHGVCNEFIQKHQHHTPLNPNYQVLDALSQSLFIFEHFDKIIAPEDENDLHFGRYQRKWNAIDTSVEFFNKITEELVEPPVLSSSPEQLARKMGAAYTRYKQLLFDHNRIDFSHQQTVFLDLLDDPEIGPVIRERVKYVMVDEYQDTNYVQEQIVLRLAGKDRNVCVVGDDDQAMYRFRGATVRNILEFPGRFPGCRQVRLSTNYRSHRTIIEGYNRFMGSADWSNPNGPPDFRFSKTIMEDPQGEFPSYPAICSIWGTSAADEADRFAGLVEFLKTERVVEDYSQIALLMYSVRLEHSERYMEALGRRGIPAFCPRARAFFDNQEVRDLVACFAAVLGWDIDGRGELRGFALNQLASYIDDAAAALARRPWIDDLRDELVTSSSQIAALQAGESLDWRLADLLYRILACEPFRAYLADENSARNIARFSQLITTFQNYYHHTVISVASRRKIRFDFFNSFLRLLHSGGMDEYEDPDDPFPKGHVQVMTIHQSKGLEFPVVIVDSLAVGGGSPKQADRLLGPYYHRAPFEPEKSITLFDRMRQFYVAFSRAEKLLVLTTHERPLSHFEPIWQNLDQWPYVKLDLLKGREFKLRNRMKVKKNFSFTMDLRSYETCPRQYEFFRHYEFSPARSAELFFGSLVHGTIEQIHRWVLDGGSLKLVRAAIPGLFDNMFQSLVSLGMRPIDPAQRELALQQVQRYFDQNQAELRRVTDAEVDVSLEKETYILTGKVDLLMGDDEKMELLDFKAQRRPVAGDPRIEGYDRQLCIYAHILEKRYGKSPQRLLLYWTGEKTRDEALMVFPYDHTQVDFAAEHFDTVVQKILAEDFTLHEPPEAHVCHDCDFRNYCIARGSIPRSVLHPV